MRVRQRNDGRQLRSGKYNQSLVSCHDAGSTYPTSGQILGRVLSTNGSSGTYTIELFSTEERGAESVLTFNSPLSRSTNTITCPTCEVTGNKNAASGYAGLDASTKLNASQLPNPSSSTLGGIQSFAAQANKFLNAISTSGVPSAAQPAASDLSNGTSGSGTMVLATSPTIASPTITGTTTATFTSANVNSTVKGIAAVSTAAVAITTSGTEYELAQLSLPAGILNSAARIVRFYAAGNYSTGSGGTGALSLTFKLKLCTVSGCGSGTVLTLATWGGTGNTTASVTNAWKLDGEVATNTTGSSGNLLTHGMSFVQLGATGGAPNSGNKNRQQYSRVSSN